MTELDQIPQEKFDAFESKIIGKDIKNLKPNYIDIQNFKNIDSISTQLGDFNVIGGYNANGKSSFVEAILTAVIGNKFYGGGKSSISPASLVKSGENKAVVRLMVNGQEKEIIIERTFKKGTIKNPAGTTTLEATINGEKIAQKDLDTLLNNLTLDPLSLGNLSIAEQIKEIKNVIGLDTSNIDNEIKTQEEATKETRYHHSQAEAVFQNFTASGVPEKVEEESLSDLLERRKIFEEKSQKLNQYQTSICNIQDIEAQILQLQNKLKLEQDKLETIKSEGIAITERIKAQGLTTLEDLDAKINEIEAHNNKAKKYKEYLDKKTQLNKASDDFQKDKEKLDNLRGMRTEIVSNSHIPEYMEISDELGILVDGIEYKLLNTARKIEVAIDLVLISGSPLRMIRIENGGELDIKTLAKIKQKIIDNNFSIFIERPIIDKYDTIIMNEGEMLEGQERDDFINNQ